MSLLRFVFRNNIIYKLAYRIEIETDIVIRYPNYTKSQAAQIFVAFFIIAHAVLFKMLGAVYLATIEIYDIIANRFLLAEFDGKVFQTKQP